MGEPFHQFLQLLRDAPDYPAHDVIRFTCYRVIAEKPRVSRWIEKWLTPFRMVSTSSSLPPWESELRVPAVYVRKYGAVIVFRPKFLHAQARLITPIHVKFGMVGARGGYATPKIKIFTRLKISSNFFLGHIVALFHFLTPGAGTKFQG